MMNIIASRAMRATMTATLIAALTACGGASSAGNAAAQTSSSPASTPTASSTTQPVQTQWGTVAEPSLPTSVCSTLNATLTPVNGSIDSLDSDPGTSQPDQSRIQSAIDACPSGSAVKLAQGSAGQTGFLSGPLQLRSGVTLWIDSGVTLFASRNPLDYDNGIGTCGTATTSSTKSCNPLILASGTTGSGIVGGGAIDGRGGSILTKGANAGLRSWWDVA